MKKNVSVIAIIFIVVTVGVLTWKFGLPYFNGSKTDNKITQVSSVSQMTKNVSKKTNQESQSSSETSSSTPMSSSSSVSSSSSSTANLPYPELSSYVGVTYYAQNRDSAQYPMMFPTSFTISDDGRYVNINGKQELIKGVSMDGNYISIAGEVNVICSFRPLGDGTVEMINQGQKLDYSTSIGD